MVEKREKEPEYSVGVESENWTSFLIGKIKLWDGSVRDFWNTLSLRERANHKKLAEKYKELVLLIDNCMKRDHSSLSIDIKKEEHFQEKFERINQTISTFKDKVQVRFQQENYRRFDTFIHNPIQAVYGLLIHTHHADESAENLKTYVENYKFAKKELDFILDQLTEVPHV